MRETVTKTMRVLALFSSDRPEWGVSEVARELGLPKSTVSELISSLAHERLLSRTSRGRYRLGWRLFELGQVLVETTEFRTRARQVLEEVVREYGETVHLAVLDGVRAVYLDKIQPRPAVRISVSWAGARLPAYSTGVGKALLAHADWDGVAENLQHQGMPGFTPNTITDLEALRRELAGVAREGYALDREEMTLGLRCAAAPVYGADGGVEASVSISVPAFRFQNDPERYIAAIRRAAGEISAGTNSEPREKHKRHTRRTEV